MPLHTLSRFSSRLPVIGFLAASSFCAAFVATRAVDSARTNDSTESVFSMELGDDETSSLPAAGTYDLAAEVPCGASSRCLTSVAGSLGSQVREVKLNGAALTRDIDYFVIDDGSSGGVIQFGSQLSRGDHVEVSGLTLETGAHTGSVSFL